MIVRGRVEKGVVVVDDAAELPEGAVVSVVIDAAPAGRGEGESGRKGQRVRLPLVRSKRPGSVELTGERAAELLGDEEESA